VEMKTRTCGHSVEVRCGTKRYEQDIEQMFCRYTNFATKFL
jgi:hypothetical protein